MIFILLLLRDLFIPAHTSAGQIVLRVTSEESRAQDNDAGFVE